jgi:N-acetylglucosaminyl-diphospho-decaprenol L-rhamnosyltransferase
MPQSAKVSISIVSHQQIALIGNLLQDLHLHCTMPVEVILTLNVPEPVPFDPAQYRFPVMIIHNDRAKGFGANHNAAFIDARSEYFCVLNPDIRIEQDPFPALLNLLANPKVGVAAPLVVNPLGGVEDSARRFPTLSSILRKFIVGDHAVDYPIANEVVFPDWVAGMFMIFRTEIYRAISGFDESYFLYYEDVNLCWSLQRRGYGVALVPAARVVHTAQRASHHDLKHFYWHLSSMLRFLRKRLISHIGS